MENEKKSPTDILSKCRRLKLEHGLDLVMIDYLQLMKSGTRVESRVQEVSEITRNLKLMAKDLNVPVIVLAQLARGTEARGKSHRPQLADLRESGSIEQDADQVLFLFRPEYYNNNDQDPTAAAPASIAEVIVAKNRHGSVGKVEMGWNGEYTRFSDLAPEPGSPGGQSPCS